MRRCIQRDRDRLPGTGTCQAYRDADRGYREQPLERRGSANQAGSVVGTYRVTFAWSGDAGGVFTLSARPKTYLIDGRRSLFVDEAGDVHWTTDDRAATADDPLVPACETAGGDCVYGRDIDAR